MFQKEIKVNVYAVYSFLVVLAGLALIYSGQLHLDSFLNSFGGNQVNGYATSQVGNFSASISTYVACTWSTVSLSVGFGSNLNPGFNYYNATNNSIAGNNNNTWYNVTDDVLSNVAVNVSVLGSDLTSASNIIGVGNVTWSSNTTSANGTNMIPQNGFALTNAYDTTHYVASNLASGSTAWFRFWLSIPSGQVAGSYTGNYTMQCVQAQ